LREVRIRRVERDRGARDWPVLGVVNEPLDAAENSGMNNAGEYKTKQEHLLHTVLLRIAEKTLSARVRVQSD
jgi:hypothetical protein